MRQLKVLLVSGFHITLPLPRKFEYKKFSICTDISAAECFVQYQCVSLLIHYQQVGRRSRSRTIEH